MTDVSHTPVETPITAPAVEPIPHDGWGSRKVIIGCAVVGLMIGLPFACLLLTAPGATAPIATFDQVTSFWQLAVPSVLVPLFAALGYDKRLEAGR